VASPCNVERAADKRCQAKPSAAMAAVPRTAVTQSDRSRVVVAKVRAIYASATSKSEAAVDDILRRYDGKEGELLAKIRLKYGNAAWLAGAGQRSQAAMPGSTTAAGGCTAKAMLPFVEILAAGLLAAIDATCGHLLILFVATLRCSFELA